jgi:hypothetical protein
MTVLTPEQIRTPRQQALHWAADHRQSFAWVVMEKAVAFYHDHGYPPDPADMLEIIMFTFANQHVRFPSRRTLFNHMMGKNAKTRLAGLKGKRRQLAADQIRHMYPGLSRAKLYRLVAKTKTAEYLDT